MCFQLCNKVMQLVGVGLVREYRCLIIARERFPNLLGIVGEVEHEHITLLRMGAIQTRKRLHGLDVRQHLVHIHGMQKRLIVAGLELVGHNEEAVRFFAEGLFNIAAGEAVYRGFRSL